MRASARSRVSTTEIRAPSLATQATAASPIERSHTAPSVVSHWPASFVRGTPEWWSATTSHWSLNTGDPELPGSVSAS